MFLFEALFSSLWQATHQLQGICSAERCFFEALLHCNKLPFSCRGFNQRKDFFPGSLLFIATSSSSAAGDMLSRKVLFRGFLLCIATSPSSAAGDSFSGKVFFEALLCIATSYSSGAGDPFRGKVFSRLSSPHCNKLFISLLCLCDLLRESISKGRTQQGTVSSSNLPSYGLCKGRLQQVLLFIVNLSDAVPETIRYALPIS